MTRDQLLEKKLDELADRTLGGESTSAAALCQDTPELLPEISRRLEAINAFERLRLPAVSESESGNTMSLAVGSGEVRTIGRYRLESLLGAGGMGEVWRAFDTQLERPVALKLLHSEMTRDSVAKARFLREARAAAKIDHDNVVSVYDVAEIDGVLVLAMPLLKGETLESLIRREGALAATELARVGSELLAGLAAAHRAGLIHRDVKPSNVWLEAPNGRVLLLDFGLARPEAGDGLTHAGGIFGTPGYMSPEQARGESLDARTDLFSAGAVLYFAATGKAPFALPGANTLAMLERTKTHEPTPPCLVAQELPVHVSDFIQSLLCKDANGRPASAEVATEQLRRMCGLPPTHNTRPIQVAETPTGGFLGDATDRMTPVPARPSKNRRWVLFTAAAAILMFVGILGAGSLSSVRNLFRSGRSTVSTAPVGPTPSPPEATWEGTLDVRVARGNDKQRTYLMLNSPGVLPLQPEKDHVQVVAHLNRPAYLYVVWIDTEGQAGWLYPWDEKTKKRPSEEHPVSDFYWPAPTRAAELTGGPAGTETLVLLAREEKLPDDFDLLKVFADLPKQQSKFREEAAWFENGQLVRNDRMRSSIGFDLDRGKPDAKKTVEIDDPVIRLQVLLRSEEMKRRFPYTRGVCFSNAGDRK